MTSSKLMGTQDVADLLQVSPRTVHRMVSAGDLKVAVKAPGKTGGYLFRRTAVERAKSKREGGQ